MTPMLPHPHDLSTLLKRLALDTGFNLAAITRPNPSPRPDAYRQWIADNKHGEMHYLATAMDDRLDITKILLGQIHPLRRPRLPPTRPH